MPSHLRVFRSISSESVAGIEPELGLNSCPVLCSETTHGSSCLSLTYGCHAEPHSCAWMLEGTSFPATSGQENLAGPTLLSSRSSDGLPNTITHWQNNYSHPIRIWGTFILTRSSNDWKVVSKDSSGMMIISEPYSGSSINHCSPSKPNISHTQRPQSSWKVTWLDIAECPIRDHAIMKRSFFS